ELMTIWGLSQSHAGVAIATILVGTQLGLLPTTLFNAVIIVVILSCITAPIFVQRYGERITAPIVLPPAEVLSKGILLSLSGSKEETDLIRITGSLALVTNSVVYPTHIFHIPHVSEINQPFKEATVNDATKILEEKGVRTKGITRIDQNVSFGILCVAMEVQASIIFMHWPKELSFREAIFGDLIDEISWQSLVPVVVARIKIPFEEITDLKVIIPPGRYSAELAVQGWEIIMMFSRALKLGLQVLCIEQQKELFSSLLGPSYKKDEITFVPIKARWIQQVHETTRARELLIMVTTGEYLRFHSGIGEIPRLLSQISPSSTVIVHLPIRRAIEQDYGDIIDRRGRVTL
ncbi:MAG TPA: hypothetical protein VJ044_05150, partial [Candidatus Hodarchaeales archaeon]|nr:hypothetical protein [Candidatus Hodarchaeales archaeon]